MGIFETLQSTYAKGCTPVTKTTRAEAGGVSFSPQDPRDLANIARTDLETYALARCIASEGHSGPTGERARAAVAIGQVVRNGAKKRGLSIAGLLLKSNYAAATGKFGEQRGRFASTSKDPCAWHVAVARAVLSGDAPDLVRGATKWNDPRSQDGGTQGGKAIQDAVSIIKKWTSEGAAWIGNIPGISSYSLMFYKAESDINKRVAAQSAALDVVALGRAGKSTAIALAAGPGGAIVGLVVLGALIASRAS